MNLQAMWDWIGEQAARAATDWFQKQSREPFTALYLYYKIGALCVHHVLPGDNSWTLADPRRLSPGATIEQQTAFIYEICRKLPFLPNEIPA